MSFNLQNYNNIDIRCTEKLYPFDDYVKEIIMKHSKTYEKVNMNTYYIEQKESTKQCIVNEDDIELLDVVFDVEGSIIEYSYPTIYPRSADVFVNKAGEIYSIDFIYRTDVVFIEIEANYQILNNKITVRKFYDGDNVYIDNDIEI